MHRLLNIHLGVLVRISLHNMVTLQFATGVGDIICRSFTALIYSACQSEALRHPSRSVERGLKH